MFKLTATASLALLASLASTVSAEQHTFVFDNRCGFGAPALVQNGRVLFVSNGPIHNYDAFTVGNSLANFTSFLSSGSCLTSGNPTGTGCTVVHGTLALPAQGGSSVQINAADGGFLTTFAYTGGSGSGCWDGYSSNGLTGAGPVETCAANDVNFFCKNGNSPERSNGSNRRIDAFSTVKNFKMCIFDQSHVPPAKK